ETAFRYLKANSKSISGSISTSTKDFMVHVSDLNGLGMTSSLSLGTLIAMCSAALLKPTISGLAILGSISIGGTVTKVDELANTLQVCLDSGAKKVLIPITSASDMGSVPPELMGKFSLIFYQTPEDAVFKALGVE
ncbi:MAG: S16 family serine protease, partial [Clostridium sp.]